MKKSKVKWELKQAMKEYYKQGFTATADRFFKDFEKRVD